MKEIKAIMAKVLSIPIEKINDSTSKDTVEDWDSFNHLILISEIEKQTGIVLTIAETEKIKSYQDLREIIERKQINKNSN